MSSMRIVEVFTHRSEDGTPDWMMKGQLELKICAVTRAYSVEDKGLKKVWHFPVESVECISVEEDCRTADEVADANDGSPE